MTYVDETSIALSKELVRCSNVHALIIGVEDSKSELNGGLSVNVGRISNREGFVIAGSGLETFGVGVISHHGLGCLNGEGFTASVKVGNVTDKSGGSADGLVDDGSNCRGTSRGQNSNGDRLTLAENMASALGYVSGLERGSVKAVLGWDHCAIDNGRASGDGGDEFSERVHFERFEWCVSHGLGENCKVEAKSFEERDQVVRDETAQQIMRKRTELLS